MAELKKPKRILVYVSFEIERDMIPTRQALLDAFEGAKNAVVLAGENYYAGKLGAKFKGRP